MKKSSNIIHLTGIKDRSPEWYQFRRTGMWYDDGKGAYWLAGGIGASEVATICGYAEYDSLAALWAEKVGFHVNPFIENNRTVYGKVSEQLTGAQWKSWDGQGWHENFSQRMSNGQYPPVRDYKLYKYYIMNSKYPWLFCTPDLYAIPGTHRISTGEVFDDGFPVEVKSVDYYRARSFKGDGVDPAHRCQLHQQMLLTETFYGEVAVSWNNGELDVYEVEFDLELAQEMIEKSYLFWNGRVLPAREAYHKALDCKASGDEEGYEKYYSEVLSYEPPPQANPKYLQYKRDTYTETTVEEVLGMDELDHVVRYEFLRVLEKRIKGMKDLEKAHVAKMLVDTQAGRLLFPDGSKANYDRSKKLQIKCKTDVGAMVENILKLYALESK
jgi:hypothetical protein